MNLSKNSPSDSESFRAAIGAVRPLKPDERYRDPGAKRGSVQSTRVAIAELHSDSVSPAESTLQAVVADASQDSRPLLREGLPRRVLRKLGGRECPVDDTFDLHGMTEKAARKALSRFLAEAIHQQLKCVRVVHGKGLRSEGPPILKLMSWQQLWRHPAVLAIKPCAPADGGAGAVLVLLKVTRDLR